MTPAAKALRVKILAGQLGFDLVGVTTATPPVRAAYYRRWLADGHAATMRYLTRNVRVRTEPARLLPGARTIICTALAYKRHDGYTRPSTLNRGTGLQRNVPQTADGAPQQRASPLPVRVRDSASAAGPPTAELTGVVAQYARGLDYHVVFRGLLNSLAERIREDLGEPFDARVFVDTGPLLERELAARAGLGWIGRNTCLLNDRLGSYLLLGEIVTTLDLGADEAPRERCGECRRCIEACPTGALVAPRTLDASRCIAYLTIEHRGLIPDEFHAAIGDRVFGCDVCQQVCPYNARAPLGRHPALMTERLPARLNLEQIIGLRSGGFRRLTRGSAGRRARPEMWRRNAAIVMANARTASAPTAENADGRRSDPAGAATDRGNRFPDPNGPANLAAR